MHLDLHVEDERCRQALARIRALAAAEGGRALLAGGCVRDALLGRPLRDLDVEVFGLGRDRLEAVLSRAFGCRRVGAAFPVLVLDGLPIDVAVAEPPDVGFEEAAARRDFTINAMGWDPERRALLDPHGGRADLEARLLRHTSPRFAEDPLRVLRGMQLVARFALEAVPETTALCRTLSPAGLAAERLFGEWRKLVLRGEAISKGLAFLKDCGWLEHFPELAALVGCPQDPEWHPEGDVWVHTLHCMDAFAPERVGNEREDLLVGLAVLCHDLGKPATTVTETDGRITSRRHERVGEDRSRAFLGRMTSDAELLREVPALVGAHLAPWQLHAGRAGDAAVRRLARRVGRIDLLLRVAAADHAGRPPKPARPFPAGDWLRERAQRLEVETAAPEPLLKGRHLLALGLQPGPRFRTILDASYEAQLDGTVSTLEEAIAAAERMAAK